LKNNLGRRFEEFPIIFPITNQIQKKNQIKPHSFNIFAEYLYEFKTPALKITS